MNATEASTSREDMPAVGLEPTIVMPNGVPANGRQFASSTVERAFRVTRVGPGATLAPAGNTKR